MRIQHLHLLRYGKFTDQTLSFPHGGRDFHMVVGANEAGKSTTRSAILDLLYGIEVRSTFDFLHPKTEMRLGATIEHQGTALEFVRKKAQTKSLFSPAGALLATSALATFLAGTDRVFFDQMFGLDHGRLETGGNAILNASNDIGQILFQSAAGIASLGIVRNQLEAEADTLWAQRRANTRAYYSASDDLARADDALKAVAVRAKDWMDARNKVQEIETSRDQLRERYRGFEAERIRLERVRRVAPALRDLRDRQAVLQQLGEVVELPREAAQKLADTELELAGAERDRELYTAQAKDTRERLALVRMDERLLKHELDILAVSEQCQQVRNHERDIEYRRREITVHWEQVETLVRRIGWPTATEEALTHKLPTLPARSTVARLVKRFDILDQAKQAADESAIEKKADLSSLDTQLKELSVSTVPAALRVALTSARALGDLKAGTRRADALVSRRSRELGSAVATLGRWSPDLVTLRGMTLPSEQAVRQRQKLHTDAQALRKTLTERQQDLNSHIEVGKLEVAQYRNAHHPISAEELTEARARRDGVWRAIKTGDKLVSEVAADFEDKLGNADRVSDRRYDEAQETSELQSKLDALEIQRQHAAENAIRQTANDDERASMDADWTQVTGAMGLAGLPLQDFERWRADRDKVLGAEDALTDAQQELHTAQQTAQDARAALGEALAGAGIAFNSGATFETLLLIASDAVDGATETKARLDELNKQRKSAANALGKQTEKAAAAQAEFDAWSGAWSAATAQVSLSETLDAAAAEGALTVMAEIDNKLKTIHDLRKLRIETMQRDLGAFERAVAVVVSAAAPELSAQGSKAAVSELTTRLAAALDDKKDADRLRKELKTHEDQAKSASERVDRAKATVLPLLRLAQVNNHDDLRALIARSDKRRLIQAEATTAQKAVKEGGDSLTLEALEAEVAATDAAQIPALIADIAIQIDSVRQAQDAVTAELTLATGRLEKIAGQDDAARAEAERQDALAKMANAAERYIKVYTASRLLKWAIDRYRETKQGPMLTRAGEIFCALTLGSFQKLTVDFEKETLMLRGLRAGGGLVDLAGMSDGTRDQLYLALRLAALELHLGQGHTLPFIADDLFISYDDQRAKAGLEALARLSEQTQVIFLSHHSHLVPTAQAVFGSDVNVVSL